MSGAQLTMLVVEDDPADFELVTRLLSGGDADPSREQRFTIVRADRLSRAVELLGDTDFDVVLLDLGVPDSEGLDSLSRIVRAHGTTPVVVFTDDEDRSAGLAVVRAGAQDYLVKDRITSDALNRVIRYAIERKRSELEIAAKESLYRTLVQTIPEIVWLADNDGQVTFLNRAWSRLTGRSEEDGLGSGWITSLHPDDRARVPVDRDLLCRGEPYRAEFRLLSPDGTCRYLTRVATPVKDPTGAITRWVGIDTDLTEQKGAEDQLARSNEELEKFAYVISHDLREPLRTIASQSDLLSSACGADLGTRGEEFLETIRREAGRGQRLIADLLDYSRFGCVDASPEKLDGRDCERRSGTAAVTEQQNLATNSAPVEILLVEDSAMDAHLTEVLLSRGTTTRHTVERATTLAEGIERMRSRPFDVVLLDLTLSDSIGLETLDGVRAEAPAVPVIVLTGVQDDHLEEKAARHGAQDYLVKGEFDARLLQRAIRYAIERIRSAAALRESEEKFRQLSETIHEVFWLMDWVERNFIYVSPAYSSIWGRPVRSLYADPSSWLDGVHPDDRGRVEKAFVDQAAGNPFDEEYRIVPPDGSVRWIRDRRYPIRDRTGDVYRIAGLAGDITERRKLEIQLAQAQKLESIGQLAAGIAHEINTPMQFVGDNTRFLEEGFPDLLKPLAAFQRLLVAAREKGLDPELIQEIETAVEEADLEYLMEEVPTAVAQSLEGIERVTRIVRAMKEFSHPGADEKTPTNLNHAIETTITVARNEWKYVAEVETDLDPSLPDVPVLPGEFNQVVLALIVNAAHAIADVIDGSSGEKGSIKVSTRVTGDRAEVRIRDTGGGIPEAVRPRIFEPFFTTKDVGKGTGQGLAIAYGVVVQKHGGTIHFETESGRGTEFIMRLPLNCNKVEDEGERHGETARPVCG